MVHRRPPLAVLGVVQHEVPVREGAALRVLSAQPNRRPSTSSGREREALRLAPVDAAFLDRDGAPRELLRQLRVDGEALRHGEQLRVQLAQPVGRHRGDDLGRALARIFPSFCRARPNDCFSCSCAARRRVCISAASSSTSSCVTTPSPINCEANASRTGGCAAIRFAIKGCVYAGSSCS